MGNEMSNEIDIEDQFLSESDEDIDNDENDSLFCESYNKLFDKILLTIPFIKYIHEDNVYKYIYFIIKWKYFRYKTIPGEDEYYKPADFNKMEIHNKLYRSVFKDIDKFILMRDPLDNTECDDKIKRVILQQDEYIFQNICNNYKMNDDIDLDEFKINDDLALYDMSNRKKRIIRDKIWKAFREFTNINYEKYYPRIINNYDYSEKIKSRLKEIRNTWKGNINILLTFYYTIISILSILKRFESIYIYLSIYLIPIYIILFIASLGKIWEKYFLPYNYFIRDKESGELIKTYLDLTNPISQMYFYKNTISYKWIDYCLYFIVIYIFGSLYIPTHIPKSYDFINDKYLMKVFINRDYAI